MAQITFVDDEGESHTNDYLGSPSTVWNGGPRKQRYQQFKAHIRNYPDGRGFASAIMLDAYAENERIDAEHRKVFADLLPLINITVA